MGRREMVNYSDENGASLPWPLAPASPDAPTAMGMANRSASQQCLYFGPAGQRCNRFALADGFCPQHRLGQAQEDSDSSLLVKRAAAVIGALAILWPIIADLLRELHRLLK
jgi:hypothetical protein